MRLAEQGTLKFWGGKKPGKNGQNEHFENILKLTEGLQKPKEYLFKKNS